MLLAAAGVLIEVAEAVDDCVYYAQKWCEQNGAQQGHPVFRIVSLLNERRHALDAAIRKEMGK